MIGNVSTGSLCICLLLVAVAFAQDGSAPKAALPEGPGLAARYPGDVGIGEAQAVVFAENFEEGTLEDVAKRWGEASNKEGKVQTLSDTVPPGSPGERSLQMTGTLGENSGGHLFTTWKPGLDTAFLRFYTRFAEDHGYEHHFVELGGYNPPTPWPNPKAGSRPNGDDRISVFIDPVGWYGRYPPPGVWNLYTYWHQMKASADNNYWGNCLQPAKPVPVPRGRWQCVELMVKLNSAAEKDDGELALWIDGALAIHVATGTRHGPWSGMGFQVVESGGRTLPGLNLRTSTALTINHLWLEHYVDPGAQESNKVANPNPLNRVWFDDVVVATEYIGPLVPASPAEGSATR